MIIGAVATLIIVLPLILHLSLSQITLSILFFALGFFTSTQVISYPLIAESNDADVPVLRRDSLFNYMGGAGSAKFYLVG